MAITPITAQIRHFNIDQETGIGQWLTTSYQLDKNGIIDLIQSWTEDMKPFPLRLLSLEDLDEAIRDQRGAKPC